MTDLTRENQLLKNMVVHLATMLKEILEHCPDDIRTHENSIRMLETSQRLIDAYGPTLSTSDYRQ
jgi:hypothetical protein